jgi:hypothetical protein
MDTEALLDMLRRRLDEADESLSALTDGELLEVVGDVQRTMVARRVAGASDLVIQADQTQAGYGITPDPAVDLGVLLVLGALGQLLRDTFRGRLNRGELGVSWQSGLEQESTISAADAYRAMVRAVDLEFEEALIIYRTATTGSRKQ